MAQLQQRRILITGNPRIGKTTIIKSVISAANEQNLVIAGIMTPEILEGGKRKGFQIVNLKSGKKETLASLETVNQQHKKWRVGRYRVYPNALKLIAIPAIRDALEDPIVDLLIIDEIGKMEVLDAEFAILATEAITDEKYRFSVLATLGRGISRNLRNQLDSKLVETIRVHVSNRDDIAKDLQDWIQRLR